MTYGAKLESVLVLKLSIQLSSALEYMGHNPTYCFGGVYKYIILSEEQKRISCITVYEVKMLVHSIKFEFDNYIIGHRLTYIRV